MEIHRINFGLPAFVSLPIDPARLLVLRERQDCQSVAAGHHPR
jgi:hypothetical protein